MTVYGLLATLHVVFDEIVPETEVPADTGEMETKARSSDRAMTVRSSEPRKRSVLTT